ncbi:esterase B1-like isoform X2 [Cydia pomonella]|uniref:esterase B1-like isoform X2 n=1 Tax=Cydia pomonella TaxID=82600 RepID=UPI002ADDB1E0|nr:esterase B1-like isoform X2 [Cydia pomonella]
MSFSRYIRCQCVIALSTHNEYTWFYFNRLPCFTSFMHLRLRYSSACYKVLVTTDNKNRPRAFQAMLSLGTTLRYRSGQSIIGRLIRNSMNIAKNMFPEIHVIGPAFLYYLLIAQQLSQASVPEITKGPELPRPIVHTPVGSYRGLQAQDGDYSLFLGIPYARVDPDNVFGPPIPHKFEGIFEAVDDTSRCPQIEEFNHTITGSLDCLHVNIHVPNSAGIDNPLPVMVHIYGGIFEFGFAGRYVYGPRFLVRHDVIFITFNYRVGPYGFMCLNTSKVPGNQGLKDQIQALRWIKKYIRYFGGDESKITIGGNSSGGESVDLHQYFLQEPLYNRVIMQSGVGISRPLSIDPDPYAPIKLAKQLNYTTNDISKALTFLNKLEPHELIAATRDSGVVFGPCVEKQFKNTDNYITKYPADMNTITRRDVDGLIGINNDEAYAIITIIEKDEFESTDYVSRMLETYYDFKNDIKLSDEIKKIVRLFYYGDDLQCADNKRPEMNVYADFVFHSPIFRTVRKYLESGVNNTYFYMFSFAGERNYHKDLMKIPNTEGGAAHADELGYLFDISYMKDRVRDEDMLIVDRMTELWTNFVKYGKRSLCPEGPEACPRHHSHSCSQQRIQ